MAPNTKRTMVCVVGLTVLAVLTACSTKSSNAAAPAAGAPQHKPTSQVKLALVPGGPHPYFQPWKATLDQAKNDFGLGGTAFDETSQWDQSKQNSLVNSLGSQGYNAFGVFGVSPTDINSTFSDLKSKGAMVASLGSCPASTTDAADFCLSTDVGDAAYKAAKATIDAMGGSGVLVHLTGNNVDANTQRRIAGVQKAIGETGGKVKLLTTITDIDTDLQNAQKAVSDLLSAHGKEIQGIVTTAYNPAVAGADGVKSANLPIKVVAIDDDASILSGIKAGTVAATVAQNPTGQAYVGAWALSQLATGACTMQKPGETIDSGSFVVTKTNVDTYDTERKAKTQALTQQFKTSVLKCS
jgi:ribose transport system substrate-binding protein